jgi:hypothetical protein
MCAWTDSLASARIQDVQAVLGLLVCAGGGSVVPRHPEATGLGDTRRTGGVRTLDGPAALSLSAERGRRRSGGATSTRDLRRNVMGICVDGWLCCGVLCCGVLCCGVLCCVGLCCVVLCWVVLCCGVLCWLCCVVICCVVLSCVVRMGWVVLCVEQVLW